MNREPLTEDELDFVGDTLMKYGDDDSILDVSELDGFLTAIVSGPEVVLPSRWFPQIWGGKGHEPEWESDAEVQRFMALLVQHMNNVAYMLMEYPQEFEALFHLSEVEGKTYFIVEEWCFGYMRGVALDEEHWAQLSEDGLLRLSEIALFGSEEHFDDLDKLSEKSIIQLQERVEPAARALHAYWLTQRNSAGAAPARVESKVGRNDLCPCGSGKKFKKCCLH